MKIISDKLAKELYMCNKMSEENEMKHRNGKSSVRSCSMFSFIFSSVLLVDEFVYNSKNLFPFEQHFFFWGFSRKYTLDKSIV